MPTVHVVQENEDLVAIALKHGFRDHLTIYQDDSNAALRALRPNPDILFPGDRVNIPDRETKSEPARTGTRHRFFVRAMPSRRLRLRLVDPFGRPLAGKPFNLVIDQRLLLTGSPADADGCIDVKIPRDAREGTISVEGFSWRFTLGALNPIKKTNDSGVSGAQGRLLNLGYDVGKPDGILGPRTAAALRRFQKDRGLPVTGDLDRATENALITAHGC